MKINPTGNVLNQKVKKTIHQRKDKWEELPLISKARSRTILDKICIHITNEEVPKDLRPATTYINILITTGLLLKVHLIIAMNMTQ